MADPVNLLVFRKTRKLIRVGVQAELALQYAQYISAVGGHQVVIGDHT